jgi:rhamnogalacturonan endolyase
MENELPRLSRRSVLGAGAGAAVGAGVLGTSVPGGGVPSAVTAAPAAASPAGTGAASGSAGHGPVRLLLDGAPARVGTYGFLTDVSTIVLDNGLIRFTFGRDDAAAGILTGWTDVSITAQSVVVDGRELAHNLNGVNPRDPDRAHSFYVDAGGGKTRLVCSQVKVLRVERNLVEVAFVDTTSTTLRHEHHLIMRAGKRGLYGYNILTAVTSTSISEVRMNTRWDRSIFDHSYNWERGKGQQPTYAYLATQTSVQDETWIVDGVNNPDLPSPDSNSGNLPAGSVYTKYHWSLYHHENPMFGHYGNGFGVWFTPLGGVTDQTLAGFYGVGPQHQDLAIHQDALILNYFGANHYDLPGYHLDAGYRRLYGPWFTYVTTGSPDDPDAMIADAAAIARAEIAENRAGAGWVSDPLYPPPAERTTVTGRIRIADGRPAGNLWVLLSTQVATDVYTIHEPTYFVRTEPDGTFTLPGIPPAWQAGTTTPGSYTLYVFSADGSITDQYQQTGITISGRKQNLGTITWAPADRTLLWQIGTASRTGGEYALATKPATFATPRAYEKHTLVPADLTFTVGRSWEPTDWYYAQTAAGTWTIRFTVDRPYTGTGYLTVSTSFQQGAAPTVALNGDASVITGTLPDNDALDGNRLGGTLGRQADRSGYPRLATLTFPASSLVVGENTITLTRDAGPSAGNGLTAGNGLGWDTLILEVDEATAAAKLAGSVVRVSGPRDDTEITVKIANHGYGPANDVRVTGLTQKQPSVAGRSGPVVKGRDPNVFPVPVAATIPAGGSATVTLRVDFSDGPASSPRHVTVAYSAAGGRVTGSVEVDHRW